MVTARSHKNEKIKNTWHNLRKEGRLVVESKDGRLVVESRV